MMGVFVQVNTDSERARSHPVGYIITERGCWEWVGAHLAGGYGHWEHGGHSVAHRVIWERDRGPIPPRHELHHRCHNPPCVNPDHLEVVLRRTHPGNRAAVNAAKRYCASGHVLDETNTYIRPDGYRQCRACARRWSRESAARQTQR